MCAFKLTVMIAFSASITRSPGSGTFFPEDMCCFFQGPKDAADKDRLPCCLALWGSHPFPVPGSTSLPGPRLIRGALHPSSPLPLTPTHTHEALGQWGLSSLVSTTSPLYFQPESLWVYHRSKGNAPYFILHFRMSLSLLIVLLKMEVTYLLAWVTPMARFRNLTTTF